MIELKQLELITIVASFLLGTVVGCSLTLILEALSAPKKYED